MRKSTKACQSVGESDVAANVSQNHVAHQQALEPSVSDPVSQDALKAKKNAFPSADDVRDRIAASHRHGPWRPLELLAKAEADLVSHSAALAKLPRAERERGGSDLLAYQLNSAVNTNSVPNVMAPQLRADTVALFSALNSSDPVESILNRSLVAMTNSVMECHARTARTDNPRVVDTNLRLANKGTRSIIDLVEALERRRSPKNIVIEKLSVNAGGKAMVGNFEILKERSDKESRTGSSPGDDEETEN